MIRPSTYRAAQSVSEPIKSHFAHHISSATSKGEKNLAPIPDSAVVEAILDAAFWASLRREEGHSPKISLAFLSPEQAEEPLLFRNRLPLRSANLTKLSPGVERPGIHLGIWKEEEELYIWGTTRKIPNYCFVLDVSEPGLLVVKHRRTDGFGKFANVAVLIGDQVKIIDEASASMPDCPAILSSLLGFASANFWTDSINILVQLAVSMRAHGRGGALLVVPENSEEWRESIIKPVKYALEPSFGGLARLMQENSEQRSLPLWQGEFKREIDNIAGLTAIDGATIISDQYHLLAFGAKIGRADGKGTGGKDLFY